MYQLSSSEQELINNLQAGPVERNKAENQLFNQYAYFIREGIKKYHLTEEESFDAYSDTILQAIELIIGQTFRGDASLDTYLHKIFYNKCVDNHRKKTSKKRTVHQTADLTDWIYRLPDQAQPVIESLMLKYDQAVLKQKLNQLGDTCRKLLLLWIEGYSAQEMQAALGFKSTDVVKTSRLRCMDKLKQLYKGY
jgi:RNA polymerase sigma-70 factor (ECF subfamily)